MFYANSTTKAVSRQSNGPYKQVPHAGKEQRALKRGLENTLLESGF